MMKQKTAEQRTYYLIDYENVRGGGLDGCKNLGRYDHILIFFTENAKNLDMSLVASNPKLHWKLKHVQAGKQSADMHIASYIGYLIGKKKKACRISVVSKDTDFDKVIKFWSDMGFSVNRQESISQKKDTNTVIPKAHTVSVAESDAKKKQKKQKYGNQPNPQTKQNTPKQKNPKGISVQEKIALNAKICKALGKAHYDNKTAGRASSIAAKHIGVKNGKQKAYMMFRSEFGTKRGLELYRVVRDFIVEN